MTPLEELLETLDRAGTPGDPPFLVAAFGAPPDGGLLVTDPDCSHLLGWEVPPECWAVGLVGGGRTIAIDPIARGAGDAETNRVRLCCLVGRDGAVASLLRSPDGAVMASGESEGRIVDALRRALGLPTPQPERGTGDLLAVLWLENLRTALDTGEVRDWPEAAALHPAMRVLATDGVDVALEHVTMIARVATAAWSWENLRLQACREDWLSGLVPAALAQWMDEGMFSRWLLAGLPPLAAASSLVRQALDPSVWNEVRAVMESTGVGESEDDTPPRFHSGGYPPPAAPSPGPPLRATPRN